jgi:hypothetical protein
VNWRRQRESYISTDDRPGGWYAVDRMGPRSYHLYWILPSGGSLMYRGHRVTECIRVAEIHAILWEGLE